MSSLRSSGQPFSQGRRDVSYALPASIFFHFIARHLALRLRYFGISGYAARLVVHGSVFEARRPIDADPNPEQTPHGG